MITIFSTLKPFEGHISIIQRNAIMSWKNLKGKPEIILLGNEPGVAEICKELDLIHIPDIAYNEYKKPLCEDVFQRAQKIAKYDIVAYVNADIILMDNFIDAAKLCGYDHFLMVGQRFDLNIAKPIDFRGAWTSVLKYKVRKNGVLHKSTGIDYFVFRKNDWLDIPPMVIGVIAWDNWLVSTAINKGHIVIDATEFISVIHQNHVSARIKDYKLLLEQDPQSAKNRELADTKGGRVHSGFTNHAPWVMTVTGEIKCR